MHNIKAIAKRGSLFGSMLAVLLATFIPATSAFADALNPLTNRSLTLSSSAPGWDNTDGSGNSTYAQPNSGANGQKTGNTFAFNVSTDLSASSDAVKGYSFQYCTKSAGNCIAPGNDSYVGSAGSYTGRTADSATAKTSDLNVVTTGASEITSGTYATVIGNSSTTGIPIRTLPASTMPAADDSQGNFVVLTKDKNASTWSYSADWHMTSANVETGSVAAGTATGKNNMIYLTNSGTGDKLQTTGAVKIIFFGTDGNYITNPGEGAFFVKINNYKTANTANFNTANLIDGGVTVANVMNLSIEIQTKVLETMDFSVGTVDPYTLSSTDPDGAGPGVSQLTTADSDMLTHGQCDAILPGMTSADPANTLQLGDQVGENSLSTTKTYSTHSYWRLSSNSSAGATVYYSGVTLKNTVGDEIAPIGTTATAPSRGTPQFGLALANGTINANTTGSFTPEAHGSYAVDYGVEETAGKLYENGADKNATQGINSTVATDTSSLTGYHAPQLSPLSPAAQYDQGAGVVNGGADYGADGTGAATTKFAFDPTSNTIPTPIASESASVVDCVTAKVRYIANIAATTPAGIYTTKINYIAAPQY